MKWRLACQHRATSPTETLRGVVVFASGELYPRLERGGMQMRMPYDLALASRRDSDNTLIHV